MDPVSDFINAATYFTIVRAPYRLLALHPVLWSAGISIFLTRLCLAFFSPRSWCVSRLSWPAHQTTHT